MSQNMVDEMEYSNADLKRHTVKGVFWKISERVAAQGISLIVAIILARILSPDDYSVVSIVTIFFTFANLFISSGLNTALIQKKNADILDYSSVLHISVIISIVLYSVLFFCAPLIANAYKKEILTPVIRVMGITLIINAIKSITSAHMSNKLEFKKFFFATIGGTIVSAFVGIWMALNGFGAWALVAQQMTNAAIDTIILFITAKIKIIFKIDINRLKSLFAFGWKIFVASIFTTIYDELNPLIIGLKFSTADLAFYSKGKSFPAVIDSTVSNTFSAVLFPVMAKVQDDKKRILDYTRKFIKICSFLIFPLMFGFLAISDNFVNVLLTDKWTNAAFYLKIFAFASSFNIITTANLQAIRSMGRSDIILKLELVKKITYFLVVAVFVLLSPTPQILVFAVLINSAVSIICNTFPNRRLIGYRYRDQIKDILLNFLSAAFMAVCVYSMNFLSINKIVLLVLQLFTGIFVYSAVCLITKNENFKYLISELRRFVGKRSMKVIMYNLVPTPIRDKYLECKYSFNVKKISKRRGETAKVAFFVLFGANWNSYKTVYENLVCRKDVECKIFVIPRVKNDVIADIYEYRENVTFFKARYGDCILVYNEKTNHWVDIKEEFDYIFYDEPYHNSYKREFNAKHFYKKAKVCYVPYGFPISKTKRLIAGIYDIVFLRYCYAFFSPTSFVTERVHYLYRYTGEKYHHVYELGYPKFDSIKKSISADGFKVLWIPRFTVNNMRFHDPSETTSFFDYKDLVIDSKENFIIRPHPLAFSKYIEYGAMSEIEVQKYKETVKQSTNTEFDSSEDYVESFDSSFAMLADFSSLIAEYMCTGKPVIYCGNPEAITDKVLLESLYIEKEWGSIVRLIERLKTGYDPLKENRIEYLNSIHANDSLAGKRIAEAVMSDFYKP